MFNKNYLKVICCLALILGAGSLTFAAKSKGSSAGTSNKVPEWVTTPVAVFPTSTYFNYVGSGSDRSQAELQAVSGLASIFGQSVKSASQGSSRMSQAKTDGRVATASIKTFSQDVLKQVDVNNLIGIEIKEYWFDGTSTWYAIAVLEKETTADIYETMIKKNGNAIHRLIENAAADKYSIESYAAYDFAQDIAVENEEHLKKMAVISPDRVTTLKSYVPSPKEISAQKLEIAKNIPIKIEIGGDDTGSIRAAVSDVIGKSGFRGSFDASVRYLIIGEVTYEESASSDKKTTKCRYNLELYLVDSNSGQKLIPFSLTGREGHVQYSEAKNRAVKAMVKKLGTEYAKCFDEYLKSFSGQ